MLVIPHIMMTYMSIRLLTHMKQKHYWMSACFWALPCCWVGGETGRAGGSSGKMAPKQPGEQDMWKIRKSKIIKNYYKLYEIWILYLCVVLLIRVSNIAHSVLNIFLSWGHKLLHQSIVQSAVGWERTSSSMSALRTLAHMNTQTQNTLRVAHHSCVWSMFH